jgi:hypothetical protein
MNFVTVESAGELHENQRKGDSARRESVCLSVE